MGDVTLTKIVFAGLVTTFVIASVFGFYSGFLTINGATIEEPYNSALINIANQYDGFEDVANTAGDEGLVKNILDFGRNAITGTVNVFVVGLEAIGSFFSVMPIIGNVVSIISETVPAFKPLLGLFSTILVLYIAMRYIKSTSNKQELP